MAEAVVSIALQTLRDLLIEKGKLLFAVAGEVKALQTQLKEIKCFLEDADKKQHESKIVRNWIVEIRDLAYRSEDVVAEYSVRMSSASSSSSDGWGRRLLHRFSGVRHSSLLYQLSSEMLLIKSELARITKAMEGYGINRVIDGAAISGDNQNLARKAFPNFEIGECFVGKEEDLKRLVSLVVDDKEHRVISVWGMGGIGKTTIAKKVYNQIKEAKNSCFDCFVWVCISQQCQIRTVLEDILKQMEGGSVSDLSDVQLNDRLCELQTNKRCLIVVDDLWQISHWNALKHAFPALDNLQSKILVTTRKQKVAEIGFSLQLGLLNMDEGLELLQKKAFPPGHIPAGVAQLIGKALGHPLDFLSGKSCSSVCTTTWDFICYIENFCVAQLFKFIMVAFLVYFVLLFLYLLFNLGVCQCICCALCHIVWAFFSTYVSALHYCCTCCLHKLRSVKRRRRRDVEESSSSSGGGGGSEDGYELAEMSTLQPSRNLEHGRSQFSKRKSYKDERLKRSLRPSSHRARVELFGNSVHLHRKNIHRSVDDHVRVTRSSKFSQQRSRHRLRTHHRR